MGKGRRRRSKTLKAVTAAPSTAKRVDPAKIAPPRLRSVYPRVRLFRELDRARQHPIIWLSAPAGYGKTTLVASYLKTRKLPTLWYQLAEADGDLATHFHRLGLAAQRAVPHEPWSWPVFTPEYVANVPLLARRTFEHLAKRLPPGTVTVFDNYQDLPGETALHEVLHNGFSQIPRGMNVVVISRHEPPPAYVSDRENGVLVVLGQEDLRLTEQESMGICDAPREAIFDYFYREIFQKADPQTQRQLLRTAYLPMENPRRRKGPSVLTDREQEVVEWAAQGHHNKLIAHTLGIAHATVRVLVARAARKLRAGTRDELIRRFANVESMT
jgi:ATP/maltotriose-dependent transcriptional regulator MalT